MWVPPENRKPSRIKGVHWLIGIAVLMGSCTMLYVLSLILRLWIL